MFARVIPQCFGDSISVNAAAAAAVIAVASNYLAAVAVAHSDLLAQT